jgi:transketolase
MRNAFVRELTAIAARDPNTLLITGDLGFGVLTDFARRFPRQYLNAGVAEQNMTALATGLALEGRTVFTYSIANFPTLRCLEQIRNDVCYHRANVKIVSIGAGFAYGPLGISHHATEDIAIMRALPNLTVFSPADPHEVNLVTRAAHATAGACYLRLGRGGEPTIHPVEPEFSIGEAIQLVAGRDVVILGTGGIVAVAQKTRALLAAEGIDAALFSVPTLKPFPVAWLRRIASAARLIVTIEEHSVIGGLGGGVAEVVAETPGRTARLLRCGLSDEFSCLVGSQDYLRRRYGLAAEDIAPRVRAALAAT